MHRDEAPLRYFVHHPSCSSQGFHAGIAVAAQPLIAHHNRPSITAHAKSRAPICFHFSMSLRHSSRLALRGDARRERSRKRSDKSWRFHTSGGDEAEQATDDDEQDIHGEHRHDDL